MSPTGSQRPPAFTLIELIVVIVVIGVLAAVTVPSMIGQMNRASLKESARTMLRTAQYARRYAVMHHRRCRLVIQPDEGQYALVHESDPVARPGQFQTLKRDGMRPRSLPEGVTIERVRIQVNGQASNGRSRTNGSRTNGSQAGITFTPEGTTDAAIVVLAGENRAWSLRTAPHTGRATLSPGRVEELLSDRKDLDL